MVKITTVAVAALAAIAPVAEARNCRQGLTYCGYVLLRRGKTSFHPKAILLFETLMICFRKLLQAD